uniref:Uncharacterized protein n=1 Tax=uncultured marine microorganism HF4000_ANIW141I9 TaxID=455537 RepID=B3T5G2_9ZZZZ|nr:hypothetical protein ALOHA_HF4000ANIW141I9ctg2g8 [uncultured marine microorganism HF4000_ANIW141I9]
MSFPFRLPHFSVPEITLRLIVLFESLLYSQTSLINIILWTCLPSSIFSIWYSLSIIIFDSVIFLFPLFCPCFHLLR